jgi:hypothetical protein
MTPAKLAVELGWDIFQIRAQPAWFIRDVILYLNAKTMVNNEEVRKQQKNAKKQSRKRGR